MEWKALCLENGPSAREGHSLTCIYDQVYLFGGYDGTWVRNDMYTLCNILSASPVWHILSLSGPSPCPRSGHTATYLPYCHSILIFGGFNGDKNTYFNDVHLLDIDAKCWKNIICTGDTVHKREAHTALLVHDHYLIVHGGYGRTQLGDCHVLNCKTWEWKTKEDGEIKATLKRSKHGYVVSPTDDASIWIFGGDSGGTIFF